VWALLLHPVPHEGNGSQNSVLLQDLCRVYEPHLSYMDVSAAVTLHLLPKTRALRASRVISNQAELSPTKPSYLQPSRVISNQAELSPTKPSYLKPSRVISNQAELSPTNNQFSGFDGLEVACWSLVHTRPKPSDF
jgi:hypothetical protein